MLMNTAVCHYCVVINALRRNYIICGTDHFVCFCNCKSNKNFPFSAKKKLSVYDVGVNLRTYKRAMPQKSGNAFNVHAVL